MFQFIAKKITNTLKFNIAKDKKCKNIFLYCSRRGGSTVLMQALAGSLKATYVDQPFSTYSAKNFEHISSIPKVSKSEMLYLDEEDENSLKKLILELSNGDKKYNSSYRPFAKDFNFFYDTVIFKVTNAKSYILKINEWFGPTNIIFLRHPLAVSLSCFQNGWGYTNHAFLNNRKFVQECLTQEQYSYCKAITDNGTTKQKHIVNWFLDHAFILSNLPKDAVVIKYEDLLTSPLSVANSIKETVTELDVGAFIKSLEKPSKSSKFSSSLKNRKKVSPNFIKEREESVKNNFNVEEIFTLSELFRLFKQVSNFYEY